MTDAIKNLILLVVVAGAAWLIYDKYERSLPCATPVHYTVGRVDSRFGVSESTLASVAQKAAAIWNTAAGKEVLTFDATPKKGDVPVSLIYDNRQQNAELGQAITRQKAALDARRAALQAGGATRTEVASYNADVRAFNQQVALYNQSAGKDFEEGEYTFDGRSAEISIFEFTDQVQLERVLAHELGHAIGLEHNDNEDSIMYTYNEAGNLTPTKDDLAALKTLCRLD